MNKYPTWRFSQHRSAALGILTLLLALILAPCLHAQGAEVVGPHSPASHATDRDPCCVDSSLHRFTGAHPPCVVVVAIVRSASDRDPAQPGTPAIMVPVRLDSDQADSQWVRRFGEERGMPLHALSLYTLHRQYRL